MTSSYAYKTILHIIGISQSTYIIMSQAPKDVCLNEILIDYYDSY